MHCYCGFAGDWISTFWTIYERCNADIITSSVDKCWLISCYWMVHLVLVSFSSTVSILFILGARRVFPLWWLLLWSYTCRPIFQDLFMMLFKKFWSVAAHSYLAGTGGLTCWNLHIQWCNESPLPFHIGTWAISSSFLPLEGYPRYLLLSSYICPILKHQNYSRPHADLTVASPNVVWISWYFVCRGYYLSHSLYSLWHH